jgi:hypothetical protein
MFIGFSVLEILKNDIQHSQTGVSSNSVCMGVPHYIICFLELCVRDIMLPYLNACDELEVINNSQN